MYTIYGMMSTIPPMQAHLLYLLIYVSPYDKGPLFPGPPLLSGRTFLPFSLLAAPHALSSPTRDQTYTVS